MILVFLAVLVYTFVRVYVAHRKRRKLEAEQEIQLHIYQGRRHRRGKHHT